MNNETANLQQTATIWERLSDETGATAVEYGAMVALILAVIIAVVTILGGQVREAFATTCNALGAVDGITANVACAPPVVAGP